MEQQEKPMPLSLNDVPPKSEFLHRFNGRLVGIRRWRDLDHLVARLHGSPNGWFVYLVGEAPPEQPRDASDFLRFVDQTRSMLRRDHDHDFCGIVYVDDPENPGLVKIYDPNSLGSACSSSSQPVLPGWVLSRWPPVSVGQGSPIAANRRRWWRRLFP